MMKDKIILDFDGTVTNVEEEAIPFYKEWRNIFALNHGIPVHELPAMEEKARAEIEGDHSKGWIVNDVLVCPPADPYIMNTAIYLQIAADHGLETSDFPAMFQVAYNSTDTCFKAGAAKFLDYLVQNHDVVIVSNSTTEPVERKLDSLGSFDIPVIGNAKKYVPKDVTDLPQYITFQGFPRPTHLHRGHYLDVLEDLDRQNEFYPGNAVVIGDVFELDLALPDFLGYAIIHMAGSLTPQYEKDYAREGRFLAKDFEQAKELLEIMAGRS